MEECYVPLKLKRKELDEVNDDFCDLSLSSPATKMRRLNAELPSIIEEEGMMNPVVFKEPEHIQGTPIMINELSCSLPVNEERAVVLYDPMNNIPLLQARSPFSISVDSDFLTGFKNPVIWANRSRLLESLNGKKDKQDDDQNNGSMAVVPWVPLNSQHQQMAKVEALGTEVSGMMDADEMESITMEVEENNSQEVCRNDNGSAGASNGVNQWQQHCMIPQPSRSLSTPVAWSGTGV